MIGLLRDHLEKLNHFTVIAETPSIHKASEKLHISQPALGRSLKKLEDILGYQLLERTPQGTKLTKRGERLYQFSKKMLNETKKFEQELFFESPCPNILTIRVATFTSIANSYLIELVKKVEQNKSREDQLDLRWEIFGLDSNEGIYKLLEEDQIDLAIMVEPKALKGFYMQKVESSDLGFYLSPQYPYSFKKKKKYKFCDFDQIPIIINKRACLGMGHSLDSLLWSSKKMSRMTYTTNNFSITLEWVLRGIGIGILPRIIGRHYVQEGTLIEINIVDIEKSFGHSHLYALYSEKSLKIAQKMFS